MTDDRQMGRGERDAEFVLTVRWDSGEILTANRAVWQAMHKDRDDIVGGFYDGVMKQGVPTTLETHPEAVEVMCRMAESGDTEATLGPIDEVWMPTGASEPLRIQAWLRWTNYQLKNKLGWGSTVGAFVIHARRVHPSEKGVARQVLHFTLDLQKRFKEIDDDSLQILQYTREWLRGKSVTEVLRPSDRSQPADLIARDPARLTILQTAEQHPGEIFTYSGEQLAGGYIYGAEHQKILIARAHIRFNRLPDGGGEYEIWEELAPAAAALPTNDEEDSVEHLNEYLHTLRVQAEAINNLVAQQGTLFNLSDLANGAQRKLRRLAGPPQPAPEPPPEQRRHVPQNKEVRTWAGCRAYYQRLEHATREALQLKKDDPVTPEMFWEQGGPSKRTTDRTLVDTYGFPSEYAKRADFWPPSTWPEEQPEPQPSQPKTSRQMRRMIVNHSAHLVAAGWGFYWMLDALDGRLDNNLRMCLHAIRVAMHTLPRLG